MKKLFLMLLFAPSLLMAQTNGLTLAEVRARVLAGNPSVQESAERIAAAEATLKQVRSAWLPSVSFNASYGHVDFSMHPEAFPEIRVADSFLQGQGTLQANWLLFDGFAREAGNLASKYAVEQSRELADETRRMLILSATVSFRQAQLARQSVVIAEQDLSFNKKLEADAQKRFAAGEIPKADVHNFSIRALQAESAMLQAKLDYSGACTVLAELMALPGGTLPENQQPVAVSIAGEEVLPDIDSELVYALEHRPDWLAMDAGRRILEQQVRAAKGDFSPRIALTGSISYTDNGEGYSTVGHHGNYNSFAGIAASWDLFSGGRKVNAVKLAQAQLRMVEQQQSALRLSIRSELQRRIDEAETAHAILARQERIRLLAVEVRDSVEKSYRAGAASITRLNEAQTGLVRAEGAYASAAIAYQLTCNQLEIESGRVMGEL